MKLTALGSSSMGNCFVMEFGGEGSAKPLSLMVECGFSYQTIVRKATPYGIKLSDLSGCLITHSHKDHALAAPDLAKRGIPIHATNGTIEAMGLQGTAFAMPYHRAVQIDEGLYAMAFRVNHDAPEPAGFIIKTKKETVLFAIDASEWLDDLSGIAPDYLFIEANYDPTLMAREQFSLQRRATITDLQRYRVNERIKSSHMSIAQTLATVGKVNRANLKAVFLTHLSDRMSAPQLWKEQVSSIAGVPCKVCRKDCGIE